MYYFKILKVFIFGILLEKEEYNIFSKKFKPLKVLVIFFLWLNVIFSIYLFKTLVSVRALIDKECPQVLVKTREPKPDNRPKPDEAIRGENITPLEPKFSRIKPADFSGTPDGDK